MGACLVAFALWRPPERRCRRRINPSSSIVPPDGGGNGDEFVVSEADRRHGPALPPVLRLLATISQSSRLHKQRSPVATP